MRTYGRTGIVALAALTVVYTVSVLIYVATAPDLRLRCVLVDEPVEVPAGGVSGIQLRATPGMESQGVEPQPGDRLLAIGRAPMNSFADFTSRLSDLRNTPVPAGGQIYAMDDPQSLSIYSLPWMVEDGEGKRWVEVEFLSAESGRKEISWIRLQSLPLGEVTLSLIWFLFQTAVLLIGGFAFWNRPYDRGLRAFVVMCMVSLGGFVGGFHWWVISGNLLLNAPFVACAFLVPATLLNFFLVYPRPKPFAARHAGLTTLGVYLVPTFFSVAALLLLIYAGSVHRSTINDGGATIGAVLGLFRTAIYAYLTLAGLYFLGSLLAVWHSLKHAANPIEQHQVRWLWIGARAAGVFIAWTLYLVAVDRVAFALGSGRIPMFLASFSFLLAYAIGIIRYRLMMIDDLVSKGVMYYVVSYGATLAVSITVGLSTLLPQLLNISITPQQTLAVAALVTMSVILLLGLRDIFQQGIDRRFFREKYQLDKALQRMNRTVGRLISPESVGEMMLSSCRDVLGVSRAAVYLKRSSEPGYRLLSSLGFSNLPLELNPSEELLSQLKADSSVQRVVSESRHAQSALQKEIRTLSAHLIYGLEGEGGINGLVILGEKSVGLAYSGEDLTFLNAVGQIANVAIHSARIDRDVARLNEELKLKLDKIADQRRQITVLQNEMMNLSRQNDLVATPPEGKVVEEFRREAIKGNSPAILRVLETVRKVAGSESSVLIRGESGTGKERLAQLLHENSPRLKGPMVRVHCASLSPSLLESELFGHVKGAFTGAHRDHMGRFEMANNGTLFLDEIGDISLDTQIKLLRVLQERCFEPVGGGKPIQVDVRLITATHQDLERLIEEGRFREDLYYRLNVISIVLPPLRDRREDVFELALHFLHRSANRLGKRIAQIDDAALSALEKYHWPGNVRELENVIERAVVLADTEAICLDDLPSDLVVGGKLSRSSVGGPRLADALSSTRRGRGLTRKGAARHRGAGDVSPAGESSLSLPRPDHQKGEILEVTRALHSTASVGAVDEREILLEALHRCDGNKAQAARLLGLARSTYFSKLKKLGIE